MKYYKVKFTLTPFSVDAADVVAMLAGEAGFESFEQTGTGLAGYVQRQLFDRTRLDELLEGMPFQDVAVSYETTEAENRNWNEKWEEEGFDPISLPIPEEQGGGQLIVHDCRHIKTADNDYKGRVVDIKIDTQMAFGTGCHETTRLVCTALMRLGLSGRSVLDCGTGTGILAISALRLGASKAMGYDIDEWAVDNARHNALLNGVADRFRVMLGDSRVVEGEEPSAFDIVMANINRNILLADMPTFRRAMAADGHLLLSGFYTADVALLTEKATSLGLRVTYQTEENDWACLVLKKV